ncbi:thiol-disulfide oxidoreductase DCC family protein [Streptomyces sp. AB3(2024)]|uniref:thiol-disulfide oxidoreductase DCC family protein n=1 Tax=Streptomyces sp. AB3(2024) TaxID=3317321 RepID=UPI0035A29C70
MACDGLRELPPSEALAPFVKRSLECPQIRIWRLLPGMYRKTRKCTMAERPILLYDGDCGFCTQAVNIAVRRLDPDAVVTPWQYADLEALGVTAERADREVLWIEPGSAEVHGGAEAVAQLLKQGQCQRWQVAGQAMTLPPISGIARLVYRVVALNRHRLPGGTAACSLPAHLRSAERDGA